MKIGDKVEILKTGRIGMIIGEGAGVWKIDFIGEDKPETISKDTPMEIVTVIVNPNPTPNPAIEKKTNWGLIIIIVLAIAGVVALTIHNAL